MNEGENKLLDYWLPPEGAGQPLGCVATTFSFDADFFEQQCIGRFVGLDTRPGEAQDDLGYLIELEEKLSEAQVSVLADRSLNPDKRSLRWDVAPVAVGTGVMHAKISLLVWQRAVRVIVGSANLTEPAYRSSLELALAFDAQDGSEISREVFEELIDAADSVVARLPRNGGELGPRARATSTIELSRQRLLEFDMPQQRRRGDPRIAVVSPSGGADAVDGLLRVWSGGPPARATVMSPFFDAAGGEDRPTKKLVSVMAKRNASIDFVVSVETVEQGQLVRLPAAVRASTPDRVGLRIFDVKQPMPDEPRKLHGKLLLIESGGWTAALVGSSNFTSPGLGVAGAGNLEIGVAIGAASDSELAALLKKLALVGEQVQLEGSELEAEEDPDDDEVGAPMGFVEVLGVPGVPASLEVFLRLQGLPDEWKLQTPAGVTLETSGDWKAKGRAEHISIEMAGEEIPFNVVVEWETIEGIRRASLPVNVTDVSKLPPPSELRDLPVDVLLRSLASMRPLHESVISALQIHASGMAMSRNELDPLKRFSDVGQLFSRTRSMSAALAGLKVRLEKPAASIDAFEWRVGGPFGPVEIARRLIAERSTHGGLVGEREFLLAEIALTVGAVDAERSARFIPDQLLEVRARIRRAIKQLSELADVGDADSPILEYAKAAFAKAGGS